MKREENMKKKLKILYFFFLPPAPREIKRRKVTEEFLR